MNRIARCITLIARLHRPFDCPITLSVRLIFKFACVYSDLGLTRNYWRANMAKAKKKAKKKAAKKK